MMVTTQINCYALNPQQLIFVLIYLGLLKPNPNAKSHVAKDSVDYENSIDSFGYPCQLLPEPLVSPDAH
jgi:hypothetical protein